MREHEFDSRMKVVEVGYEGRLFVFRASLYTKMSSMKSHQICGWRGGCLTTSVSNLHGEE